MIFRIRLAAALTAFLLLAAVGLAQSPSAQEKKESSLEELEKLCNKMRAMQTAVHKETKALHLAIEARPDKKPRDEDRKSALKLADDMKKIIAEADLAIVLLRKEGATVAFLEVFDQVRQDMQNVQARLQKCDIGKATLDLEADIIDTLREMTMALVR